LDEQDPNYVGLAQENGKWFWLRMIVRVAVAGRRCNSAVHLQKRVGEGATVLCTFRKECNKYDLTATQYLIGPS